MSPINRFFNLFRRERVSYLKNRAGGMATIVGCQAGNGDDAMNGRMVRTVRIISDDCWFIDPPQTYKLTRATHYERQDIHVQAGSVVRVNGIADCYLKPWRDDDHKVTEAEVASLYSRDQSPTNPTVPAVGEGASRRESALLVGGR